MSNDNIWVPTKRAAEHLGFSVKTLERWRAIGIGPQAYKPGGRYVRYRIIDLDRWVEEQGLRFI